MARPDTPEEAEERRKRIRNWVRYLKRDLVIKVDANKCVFCGYEFDRNKLEVVSLAEMEKPEIYLMGTCCKRCKVRFNRGEIWPSPTAINLTRRDYLEQQGLPTLEEYAEEFRREGKVRDRARFFGTDPR